MPQKPKQVSGDTELREQETKPDLSKFNYNGELSGQQFKEYLKIVEALPWGKHADFEVYKVAPVRKVRYKGVPNSPTDIVGIRIIDSQPLRTTRITPADAFQFNGRLVEDEDGDFFTVEGGQFIENGGNPNYYGIYYLLKK